jgi:hypothetical protein
MKSLKIFMVAFICLGLTSCIDAQMNKTVRGDGNVVKKERTVNTFNGVKASSDIDVYLKQGDDQNVTVEADENLHEYILTEVREGVLHVYSEVNIRNAEKKRVYVVMKDIKSLRTSSAGDIVGQSPIKTDELVIGASSAGGVKIDVTANNIEVNISSSGDVTISGEAESLNADLSSAGDLDASELKVKKADISASSAGDARVYVTEKLTARASSAGDITYKGDPRYIDAHSSSAGSIHKR